MSGLRRSRPDEQDVILRKLQDIKISHTERLSSSSIEGNSSMKESKDDPRSLSLLKKETSSGNFLSEPQKLRCASTSELYSDNVSSVHNVLMEYSTIKTQETLPTLMLPEGSLLLSSSGITNKSIKVDLRPGHSSKMPLLSPPGLTKRLRSGSESGISHTLQAADNKEMVSGFNKKWHDLYSVLEVMKQEPFDVDKYLQTVSLDLKENTYDNKKQSEHDVEALHADIVKLKESLQKLETEVKHVKTERDCALNYICEFKSTNQTAMDERQDNLGISHYYEEGIEGLRASDVTKEQVLEVMGHLVKEFKGQKSYLDRLLLVVITRAPWMLEEVDEAEMLRRSDSDDDYTDDEVWC
ncbi:CAunnamed protein product [Biomphalaria glabrata]|nr:CAunnamed protein product [Biomphalaria glabrata]